MATLTIGGKTVVTQTGTDEPIIGSDVVFPAGHVIQHKFISQDDAVDTNATMNYHSSLPTITQGLELLSLQFTPISNNSSLFFWFNTYARSSGVHNAIFALFENSTCISAIAPRHTYAGESQDAQTIILSKDNNSQSNRTYSVRFGCQPGNGETVYVNEYPRYAGAPQTTLLLLEIENNVN